MAVLLCGCLQVSAFRLQEQGNALLGHERQSRDKGAYIPSSGRNDPQTRQGVKEPWRGLRGRRKAVRHEDGDYLQKVLPTTAG